MTFTVASDSFKDGDYLPSDFILSSDFGFGCAGRNKSPHLKWSGAPEETKSFAVTCYDPDAPTGSRFWHWLLVEYSRRCERTCRGRRQYGRQASCGRIADTHRFRRAWLRRAVSTRGDRPHRYLFTVFAVKTDKLDVKADTSAAVVGFNLHFNTLAKAEIMGLFKR
jgi:Raf kinase inhibitor-like YbhB/YbcL family protein